MTQPPAAEPPSKTPPKTPRRRRKAERPPEIIAAALEEFADKGFAAARLEDVARRAGVAKGTIYLYFPDKEALFAAALRARFGPARLELEGMIAAFEGSSEELLRRMIRAAHSVMADPQTRRLMRVILAEGPRHPALTEHHLREAVAPMRALLEAILRRGEARGEWRVGALAGWPLAMMAPAMMGGLWRLLFEAHEPLDAEALAAAHEDLALRALKRA